MGENFLADVPGTHSRESQIDSVGAGDATEEQTIFVAPHKCVVEEVGITPDAAVTGNDTNRKNLNVIDKGSAGTGTTEIGNVDLGTGTNLVAKDRTTLLTGGSTEMEKGDVLSLQIEQVGTGVAIPRSRVDVRYRPASSGV